MGLTLNLFWFFQRKVDLRRHKETQHTDLRAGGPGAGPQNNLPPLNNLPGATPTNGNGAGLPPGIVNSMASLRPLAHLASAANAANAANSHGHASPLAPPPHFISALHRAHAHFLPPPPPLSLLPPPPTSVPSSSSTPPSLPFPSTGSV